MWPPEWPPGTGVSTQAAAAVATGGAATVCALWWHFTGSTKRYPASYPGGPRDARCNYRSPTWPAGRKGWRVSPGWKLAVGEESHTVTQAAAPAGVSLSGEPAGRQIWWFDEAAAEATQVDGSDDFGPCEFNPAVNPNAEDRIMREAQVAMWQQRNEKKQASPGGHGSHEDGEEADASVARAMSRGVDFYEKLQCQDGHFAGDYGGPLFLMPGLIIVAYVTGSMEQVLPLRHREAMIAYLRNHQQSDGGWGTHIEDASTMVRDHIDTAINTCTTIFASANSSAATRTLWIRSFASLPLCLSLLRCYAKVWVGCAPCC